MKANNVLQIPGKSFGGFRRGYYANAEVAPESAITKPSINAIIDGNGRAAQRLGYQAETKINLGGTANAATSFYLEQYDVTVFCYGTAVKYYDWTQQAVYDTGVTFTSGTITRMDAYAGDVYMTNATDGVKRLIFMKLAAAAAVGGNITVESSGAAKLSSFGLTNSTIRIKGVSEAYTAVAVSAGVLTAVSSAAYANGTVAVVTNTPSGPEKGSKVFFWKERMGIIGVGDGTNANQPLATEFFGKFVSAATLNSITDFTYGTGGSTREVVGKWGKVTNALPVKDFLYTFKENQSYVCHAKDVGLVTPSSSSPGAALGQTTPDLRDEIHGCINEDCAISIGNNEAAYITSDKRIMRIKISTDTGAAVVFPDENFDFFLQDDLKNMDSDQTGARAFYHKSKRRSYFQIRISGQWYWYIYDHSLPIYIPTAMGVNILYGGWYAPQQVFFAQDFFERKGVMYGTDGSSDTVYSIGTSFDDNGSPILCNIYTGNFNVGSAEMEKAHLQGEISQAAVIKMQSFVTNTAGGKQGGSQKIIDGSKFTYSAQHAVGADGVGGGGVESETVGTAEWEKNWDIYPSEANKVQLFITNEAGGYFSISSYGLTGKSYPSRSSSL